MMRSLSKWLLLSLLLAWLAPFALAQDWTTYRSDEYGFQMLVPAGTTFSEKDYGSGRGGLVADSDGVMIYAVGRLGAPASAEEIESYGARVTGIPATYWKEIERGSNANGWKWYRAVKAQNGDQVAFGGYGVGPRGSYMLVVTTTASDLNENRAAYDKWYDSLKVF